MKTDVSEEIIIDLFNRLIPANKSVLLDDDVSQISLSNPNLVISSDMLVESTDVPAGMSLKQASRKSIIMTVSDFASKGINPKYCIISIGIPKEYSIEKIKNIVAGIEAGLKEFDIILIGGDTNSSMELIIDCTMIGSLDYDIPSRKNAEIGDIVYALGEFGFTGAGLFLLLNEKKPSNEFEKHAIKSIQNPNVNLNIFVKLVKKKLINSSIDSSDGLCFSLYKIAELSNVSIHVDRFTFSNKLKDFSSKYNFCINDLILYSGEEYNIIFTVSPDKSKKLETILNKDNIIYTKLGKVKSGSPVVYYNDKILKRKGWDGFNV
tara:strand:- start:3483 stop:4445 length:963 start_codon:yes stop_codon:yes gene_type:complete